LFVHAKDLFVEANSRQGWSRQVQRHLNEASGLSPDAGLSLLSSSRAEADHIDYGVKRSSSAVATSREGHRKPI
jgi:hypothetical protein